MIGLSGVVRQKRQIGEKLSQKKPRAFACQQQGMFPPPAELGPAGNFHFHDRCAIGKGAVLKWAKGLGQTCCQFLQALPNDFVVVTSQSVTRNIGLIGGVQCVPAIGVTGRVI